MVFDAQTGEDGLRAAIDNLCKKAEEAVEEELITLYFQIGI